MDYSKYIDPASVVSIVSKVLGVDIMKNTRSRIYIDGRNIYYKILREQMNMSYASIGVLSGKTHATILHNLNNFNFYLEHDMNLKYLYKRCLKEMENVANLEMDTKLLENRIDIIERRVGLWLEQKTTTKVIELITTELHNLGVLRKDILSLRGVSDTIKEDSVMEDIESL